MKALFFGLVLICANVTAHATQPTYAAWDFFAASNSTDTQKCLNVASLLTQISSSNFKFTIDDNCSYHKAQSKFKRNLSRVLADIPYPFNEIGCHYGDGVGCGKVSPPYTSLAVYITIPKALKHASQLQGTTLAIDAATCGLYADAITNLTLSSGKAAFTAHCENGMLMTTLNTGK